MTRTGVGWCVQYYGLSRETYEAVVGITLKLPDDPDFRHATEIVARGLSVAPLLTAEALEVLRAETAFADEPVEEEIAMVRT